MSNSSLIVTLHQDHPERERVIDSVREILERSNLPCEFRFVLNDEFEKDGISAEKAAPLVARLQEAIGSEPGVLGIGTEKEGSGVIICLTVDDSLQGAGLMAAFEIVGNDIPLRFSRARGNES